MMKRMNTYAKELTFDQLADINGGTMTDEVFSTMRWKIIKSGASEAVINHALDFLDFVKGDEPDRYYSLEEIERLFYKRYGI